MVTISKSINLSFFLIGLAFCQTGPISNTNQDGPPMPNGQLEIGGSANGMIGSGNMMHHILPFLAGASPNDITSYFDIVKDKSLTIAELQNAQDAWAASKNATVQAIYNEFKANKIAKMNEIMNSINQNTSGLSATAQQVITDIESVVKDTSLTIEQQQQKIKTILDGASETDKEAIKNALPGIHKIFKHAMVGSGVMGPGMPGNGMMGPGMSGNGMIGAGISGNGMTGAEISGNGMIGGGMPGNGMIGAGISGNGMVGMNDVTAMPPNNMEPQ